MAFICLTREKTMYFGAKKSLILRARELRKRMTPAEAVLWAYLRNQQLDGKIFRRQHPIDKFIVDFYCHRFKLVIEVDGGIHKDPVVSERDKNRTSELESFGLKVIRFTNEDVINNTETVINKISQHLNA
jgi:very-short-patch-repair endonuclease